MKPVFLLALFFYLTDAILLKSGEVADRWKNFKVSYLRSFDSPKEENVRKRVFHTRLIEIEEHNERYRKGLETYTLQVNKFTDYTEEEMLPFINGVQLPPPETRSLPEILVKSSSITTLTAPDCFDWRDKGVITPVKNQGRCGSCWAFSSTGALESHYHIHYGSAINLSEQQLVDCVNKSHGCNGGWMKHAFDYIKENRGINYEKDYPYEVVQCECRFEKSKPNVTVKGSAAFSDRNETIMKEILFTKGPIAIAVDATEIAHYSSGVYYNPSCSSTKVNHAMLVVGYGTENGTDYWMVKNSYGGNWGLKGYIKMARNRNNHCGIASYTSYPVF